MDDESHGYNDNVEENHGTTSIDGERSNYDNPCGAACAVTCAAGPGKLMSRWCFWGSEPFSSRIVF